MVNESNSANSISFIHAADLHLDSPFSGIAEINQKLAHKLSNATFDSFFNLIYLAIRKEVNFVLFAGDIYDNQNKSLYSQLQFLKGMELLNESKIEAYIVHGNHDPLSGWSAHLNWPENVHIFNGKEPEVKVFKSNGFNVHIVGMSYQEHHIKDNLVKQFPAKSKKWPLTIGLLHCSVGNHGEHYSYSPCTLNDLNQLNYDYWALGHVHTPSILQNNPPIIYSGNTQGRHPGETGERGCYLVKMDNPQIKYTFQSTSTIYWDCAELSLNGLNSESDLIEMLNKHIQTVKNEQTDKSIICRYKLVGKSKLSSILNDEEVIDNILKYFNDDQNLDSQFIWIDRLRNHTKLPINRQNIAQRQDLLSEIVKLVDEYQANDDDLTELFETVSTLFNSNDGKRFLQPINKSELRTILYEAEDIILDQFMENDE